MLRAKAEPYSSKAPLDYSDFGANTSEGTKDQEIKDLTAKVKKLASDKVKLYKDIKDLNEEWKRTTGVLMLLIAIGPVATFVITLFVITGGQ